MATASSPTFPVTRYEVSREKIREFVQALNERRAVYRHSEAARQAGYRDVVAPPMFAVVYTTEPVLAAVRHRDLGVDMRRVVHAAQRFEWDEPVCAGDVITTEVELVDVGERGRNKVLTFTSASRNQDGRDTARGRWTIVVRGG
jgi:acyl dehydratase